ncbi:5651_t:CDS:2, partial [Acaulospora colombiana]
RGERGEAYVWVRKRVVNITFERGESEMVKKQTALNSCQRGSCKMQNDGQEKRMDITIGDYSHDNGGIRVEREWRREKKQITTIIVGVVERREACECP